MAYFIDIEGNQINELTIHENFIFLNIHINSGDVAKVYLNDIQIGEINSKFINYLKSNKIYIEDGDIFKIEHSQPDNSIVTLTINKEILKIKDITPKNFINTFKNIYKMRKADDIIQNISSFANINDYLKKYFDIFNLSKNLNNFFDLNYLNDLILDKKPRYLSSKIKTFNDYLNNKITLKQIDFNITDNEDQLNEAQAAFKPQTPETIFNTWARISGEYYAKDKTEAENLNIEEMTAWELLTDPDRILQPLNTSNFNAFISPDQIENYTFEATLYSDNADDDTIGLIIAYVRDEENNKNYSLALVRTNGGMPPYEGYGIVYIENNDEVILKSKQIDDHVFKNSDYKGWQESGLTRVRIIREGNIIKTYASKFGTEDILPESEILLDLNEFDSTKKFIGSKSYGYCTWSQANSTYLNPKIEGPANSEVLVLKDNNKLTVYNEISNSWLDLDLPVWRITGFPRKIFSPVTNKYYLINKDNISEI